MKISHNNIEFDIGGNVEVTVKFLSQPFHVHISVPIIGSKLGEPQDEHILEFEDVSTSDLEDLRANILKAIDTQRANGRNEYTFPVNSAIFARWLLWYVHLKAW